jgi:glycosyltransferase involved in cell wall biosynthesis
MIRISIILCFFNEERYLRRALNSLVKTYEPGVEIIIVDDGSTDRSRELAIQFTEANSSIANVRLVTQKNKGLGAARNRGVAEARGDYVTFVDADDTVCKDYCKELLALITEKSHGWKLVEFGYRTARIDGGFHSRLKMPGVRKEGITASHIALSAVCKKNRFFAPMRLVQREILLENRFGEDGLYEDLMTIPLAYMKSTLVRTRMKCLYIYHVNRGGITSKSGKKEMLDLVESWRYLKNRIPDSDWYTLGVNVYYAVAKRSIKSDSLYSVARRVRRQVSQTVKQRGVNPKREQKIRLVCIDFGLYTIKYYQDTCTFLNGFWLR